MIVTPGTPLSELTNEQKARLFDRGRAQDAKVADVVRAIIADVRARGDSALREQAERFDGVQDLRIEVPRDEWQQAIHRTGDLRRLALIINYRGRPSSPLLILPAIANRT